MMTWDQIRELGADARVTIGSHTRRHYALAKLTLGRGARRDRGGRAAHRARDRSFLPAFRLPLRRRGQRRSPRIRAGRGNSGLKTGVTMRSGLIHAQHRGRTDGVAQHLAERRIPASALRQSGAERRSVRVFQPDAEGYEPDVGANLRLHAAAPRRCAACQSPAKGRKSAPMAQSQSRWRAMRHSRASTPRPCGSGC